MRGSGHGGGCEVKKKMKKMMKMELREFVRGERK